jgi:AraC-like DNA-binding protein
MEFRIHLPSQNLRPFVQCYLEADSSATRERGEHTLFPNGHSGIFFNFGNMGKLIIKEAYKTPEVSVFGQIDRHFTVVHWPGFYSLGVLLKPSVLSQLLRVDMAEFTNKAFDGHLIRSDFKVLYQQLGEVSSIRVKIELIERYLNKELSALSKPQAFTDQVVHLIHQQKITSIDQMATHLQVSQRYLEMQFKRAVGLSPKTYSLIHRFKRMEQQVRKMPAIHWDEMSFATEYYDQNHFIKDFKRFTGLTPSDYLLGNMAMGRSYLNADQPLAFSH